MRTRALLAVAAVLAVSATVAVASTRSATVQLLRPRAALYPGEGVSVAVVNHGPSSIYRSDCFVLERSTPRAWRAVTRTHGADVRCVLWGGPVQAAHTRQPAMLWLWDDLRPGAYRITLYYRAVPAHRRVLRPLGRRDHFLRMLVTVGRAPKRHHPHLSRGRLLAIALAAAVRGGDAKPTLIQHAAGPHLEATMVTSGDLVFEWNWSYAIAIRGHFTYTDVSVPPGVRPSISGSVITLVVDAATGQETDFGLSNRYPHLGQLGKVTTDLGG